MLAMGHILRAAAVLIAGFGFLAAGTFASPALDVVQATPTLTRFTSTNNANVSLRFVSDSGVCESTPGVHQMSGYIDVGTNMSMVWQTLLLLLCSTIVLNIHKSSGSGSSSPEKTLRLLPSHSGKLRMFGFRYHVF